MTTWRTELTQKALLQNPENIGLRLYKATILGTIKTRTRKRKVCMWTTPLGAKNWVGNLELYGGQQILNLEVR